MYVDLEWFRCSEMLTTFCTMWMNKYYQTRNGKVIMGCKYVQIRSRVVPIVNFMDWKTSLCFVIFVSIFWPGDFWRDTQAPHNTLKCRILTGRSLENNVLTEVEVISCFDAVLKPGHMSKRSFPITSADGSQYISFVVRVYCIELFHGLSSGAFLKDSKKIKQKLWISGLRRLISLNGVKGIGKSALLAALGHFIHLRCTGSCAFDQVTLVLICHDLSMFSKRWFALESSYPARLSLRCSSTLDNKVSKFERWNGRTYNEHHWTINLSSTRNHLSRYPDCWLAAKVLARLLDIDLPLSQSRWHHRTA